MIKRFLEFITHGIWQKDENNATSRKERWLVRSFKIIIYTVRGMGEHNVGVRAAALTFFTLMSIVPIAALIFAVVKGFGLETNLNEYLYGQFPQYTTVIDSIMEFANNMLMRTKGGVVASVGLVVLFWAVMQVFGNIENAFNNIWEVKKARSITRKFSDYITVVVVAPVLWLISNSLVLYIRDRLNTFSGGSWVIDTLFGILSVVVLWLMFAFVYYVMPNTKVKFKGALVAAIIAGTIFQLFQFGYVFIQSRVTSYNVIYGSFAALPLFLIWLRASWIILLFGAELSFAYQNIANYEQERESLHICYDRRRKVMLATMLSIVKNFKEDNGPVKSEEIAAELNLPLRIVRDVIFDLEKSGLVATVRNDNDDRINLYIPARDINSIHVYDVVDAVETNSSVDFQMDLMAVPEVEKVSSVLDKMKEANINSEYNVPLTELITAQK